MKSMTEKEQQEVCEGMSKIANNVNNGMKTIKELGVAFGRVARAIYKSKSYATMQEINERVKAFKKKGEYIVIVETVVIFANGTIMAFDSLGEQIAECQGCILDVKIIKNLNKYCNEDTKFYKGDWVHKTRKSLDLDLKWWFKKIRNKKEN